MTIRLTLILLIALGALAPAASAADRYKILRDCVLDGKLDGRYTAGELRDARKNLPTDSDEYSDCRDQLREAELRAASAGGGGGGGGGDGFVGAGGAGGVNGMSEAAAAVAASPASGTREQILAPGNPGETAAVQDAQSGARGDRGVDVGGKPVIPGATGLSTGAGARDLPPSLLAVLILLGAGSLALAVPAVRKHARIPVLRRR